jgi:hypothetical protein
VGFPSPPRHLDRSWEFRLAGIPCTKLCVALRFVVAVLTAIRFAAMHLPLQFFLDQPVTLGSLAAAFGL